DEEQRNFPHKNVITRALGMRDTVQVDVKPHQILSDDYYLLCTDGLSGMVDDPQILKIVTSAKPLERAVAALVDTPNRPSAPAEHAATPYRAGRSDHITTLVLHRVPAQGRCVTRSNAGPSRSRRGRRRATRRRSSARSRARSTSTPTPRGRRRSRSRSTCASS